MVGAQYTFIRRHQTELASPYPEKFMGARVSGARAQVAADTRG
jgi:hypothetical protein